MSNKSDTKMRHLVTSNIYKEIKKEREEQEGAPASVPKIENYSYYANTSELLIDS